MATGKYENYIEASFRVGDQHIRVKLEAIEPTSRGNQETKKPFLKFTILAGGRNGRAEVVWQDDESRLESSLQEIVIELIVAAEQQYRDLLQWRYEWEVQEREQRIEDERQRKIEEEKLAREQKEREEHERIELLLNQVELIRKAEIIREYVEHIIVRKSEINVPLKELEDWAVWAREQADKIDPIKSFTEINLYQR